MMTFLERLKRGHEIMATSNTMCNDSLCDTSCDGTLDNGSDGVHRSNNLGLELRRDVEFDLLEEIFGSTESTNNENVLII
jgi:hypothetical protein